jgi:alkylation response protein AidB-like acyl-CoA dehydrogenase
MDFTLTEEQQTVGTVTRRLFEHSASPEHLTELETGVGTGQVRHDASLWSELAASDLLGIALPESMGGSGGSFLELAMLLVEVGWSVASVPVYATLLLGADTIARQSDSRLARQYLPAVVDGSCILTAGIAEAGRSDPLRPQTTARRDGEHWRLTGGKAMVPGAPLADAMVVSASCDETPALFLIDVNTPGVEVRPTAVTNDEPFADVALDGVQARRLDGAPDAVGSLHARALIGLAAMQLGVVERALKMAACYTGQREQFGRPIGSFQAVQQRMADAFIDVEAIRWTMWHAAWLVAEVRPVEREAAIAKFWAAEAGARVAATAQQVHGGIGIDVTYPLSRYFLWAKQIELSLGSASEQLTRLGKTYREGIR